MLSDIKARVIGGSDITRDEALYLINETDLGELTEASHEITEKCASADFDLCSIINSKSGNCTEDCKWCAQSSHATCEIKTYDLADAQTCLEQAVYNEKKGVHRFSLVNSGRKPSDDEIDKICEIYETIGKNSRISLCASLGLCSKEQLSRLYKAGVRRYHCNLESSPNYFKELCTTHTQEQKITTLLHAREVGMELCSGGIVGMGESREDRVDMALELRKLGVKSVPMNILHPLKGTALEHMEFMHDDEILRTVAVYRFILPDAYLRLAGGRSLIGDECVNRALYAGINSALVGDMLTTVGANIDQDKERFRKANYNIRAY